MSRYRWRYVGGLSSLLLRGVLAATLPYLLGRAIDSVAARDEAAALRAVALLLVVAAGKGIAQYAMRWHLITVSRDIEFDLRNDLSACLLRQDRAFFQRYRTGDLMARATNDLSQVRSLLGPGLMYSAEIVAVFVPVLLIMAWTDWRLTLLVFAPMPMISFSVTHFGGVTHERFRTVQQRFSALSTRVQEHLSGLRMLRAYNQGPQEESRFAAGNASYLEASLGLVRVWRAFYPLLEVLVGLAAIAVLGFGGWRVLEGHITVGTFTMFLYYLAMLTWPMVGMGVVVNITQRGLASLARLTELMDQSPGIADRADVDRSVRQLRGKLEWRDVTVRYPGSSRAALEGVSLRVGQGECVAVIGPVGSGKSTLAELLPRLIEPSEGSVLVDGMDVASLPLAVLRRWIGHVPQESFLFSRSIAENIRLGQPDPSSRAVARAVDTAQFADEAEVFPDGLETMVGERGITLSGGQKQRVALARAILKQPSILILDDTTANLDAETEHQLLLKIRQRTPAVTMLLVTHRVSTARSADRIVVLRGGRVVGEGRHEDLLAHGGLYSRMHDRQRIEEELALR